MYKTRDKDEILKKENLEGEKHLIFSIARTKILMDVLSEAGKQEVSEIRHLVLKEIKTSEQTPSYLYIQRNHPSK